MTETFPAATHGEWKARVQEELVPKDFDKALVDHRPDGIDVQPLYSPSPDDVADPAGFPGQWPGTRGIRPDGRSSGWASIAPGVQPRLLDPLGDLARTGTFAGGMGAAFEDGVTGPMGVSTLPYHDAGCTAAQELGIALATGVEYLRQLAGGGEDVEVAASRFVFRIAVGRDVFGGIAKLRALRATWSRVVAACGASAVPRPRIHAVTARRSLSRRDPWTNILRVTTQTFAAICGGADAITAAPFDSPLGEASELGARLAENTQRILSEESHVGRVVDPAGGSWFVESLTTDLCRAAWVELQAIERAGGMAKALQDGTVRARIDLAWEERRAALAKRRLPVTGVSEFPDADDLLEREPHPTPPSPGETSIDPFPVRSDAAPFEDLRDRADGLPTRPTVHLATLGPVAEHNARAIFARNVFLVGGLAVDQPEGAGTVDKVANRFRASGGSIACLCGADARYADEVPAAAKALRNAGAATILLAGRPGEHEATWADAGVDGYVHLGMDVLSLLAGLLAMGGAQ